MADGPAVLSQVVSIVAKLVPILTDIAPVVPDIASLVMPVVLPRRRRTRHRCRGYRRHQDILSHHHSPCHRYTIGIGAVETPP
jgi:hypothetical protein